MLKIYDKEHNAIGHIVKYKDLKIESDATTGDKTLSFTYLSKYHQIEEEFYLETKDDEYVIKEKSVSTDGFLQFVANLNLEDLEAKPWSTFSVTDSTIEEAARLAIAGSGWRVKESTVDKKRNAGILQTNTLGIIRKLCTAFMCEVVFDTKEKTLSFYEQTGSDKGVYFMSGLNMKKLQRRGSSYDYYTRIIPIGADGSTIEEVNEGKNYLENYQYSNKVKTYIWKDESYTDATALLEDAVKKLEDMSKPEVSYSVNIMNLAADNLEYGGLDFNIGDTVTLIDAETGIREKQRIVKLVRYPQNSTKDTCELANRQPSFEEMRQKQQEAQEIIDAVINSDGRYTGTISVSDILKFEEGVSSSNAVSGLQSSYNSLYKSLSELKLSVGAIETNYLSTEKADLKYATITELNATKGTVEVLNAKYASLENATVENFAAVDAKIKSLQTDKLSTQEADIKYANIDFSNIGKAALEAFFSKSGMINDLIVGDGYITGELVGVTIKGDLIESNTVVADKLVIKGTDGLYYKLNTDGMKTETEQTDYNSLNGKILIAKSVTASKIDVKDLVAFDATIGGFKITDNSIYSGVKSSVDNTTRGIYLDKDGQASFGDSDQFIKYFRDTDGNYKLSMSVTQLVLGSSKTNVETILSDTNKLAQNANSTAAAAQSTANSAKNTAESFATRISDAETKIAQNSTDISLRATKSELTTAVDGIQIGGRNLALASKDFTAGAEYWSVPSSFERSIDEEGFTILSTSRTGATSGNWNRLIPHKYIPVEDMHKGVVVSFDLKCDSLAEFDHSCVCALQVYAKNGTRIGWGEPTIFNTKYAVYFDKELSDGEWSRISIVFTEARLKTIYTSGYTADDVSYASFSFQLVKNGSIHFRKIKIEYGTKATDWTPAPEDLASSDDLESLTTRVTEAEAEINVNAGNIELKASKSELATVSSAASKAQSTADTVKSNLENNYYTKTQSDANMSVKSDAILASVKSTYTTKEDFDSLQIGGRNLARNTNFLYEQTKDTTNTNHGTNVYVDKKHLSNMIGKKITFSYYVHSPGSRDTSLTSNANMKNRFGMHGSITWSDSTGVKTSTRMQYPFDSYLEKSIERSRVVMQMTVTPPDGYDTIESFVISVQTYAKPASDNEETWEIGYPKLEYGTKATDWTPAPEDLASSDDLESLTTRATESESNITQLSNKITAEVSERTALGTRVSTVEQTASGLTTRLASAESNISTAQSMANTAKSEAVNAAKTATNYMNFSSNGLVIGDMTASTLGKNVLIDSDSVNIRNGTNTVATFAEDLIELGKDSAQTVIKLCGGAGKIMSSVLEVYDLSYTSFEIASDNLVNIRGDEAVSLTVGDNSIVMFADMTCVDKPVRFENYMILKNNTALYGESLDADPITLAFIGADNNLHIGYNTFDYNIGTYISGQTIRHRVASAGVSYKPYWEAGDSFSMSLNTAGFISSSSMNVHFTVPLSKPAIGSPAVTISSYNGLTIRQNGNYLYGSSASEKVTPSYYSATLNSNGNSIVVTAAFDYDQTANVINNEACGIVASITITFG